MPVFSVLTGVESRMVEYPCRRSTMQQGKDFDIVVYVYQSLAVTVVHPEKLLAGFQVPARMCQDGIDVAKYDVKAFVDRCIYQGSSYHARNIQKSFNTCASMLLVVSVP